VSGKAGAKNLETRYPDAVGAKHREGQFVSVTGWVRFIKLSGDDCDYHIQITPELTNTDGMVIVEIPEGDAKHVSDASFRAIVDAARAAMPVDLHLKKEPGTGGNKIGRAYMTFEGALFFDAPHYPNCHARRDLLGNSPRHRRAVRAPAVTRQGRPSPQGRGWIGTRGLLFAHGEARMPATRCGHTTNARYWRSRPFNP
jgi:hypothetical protein